MPYFRNSFTFSYFSLYLLHLHCLILKKKFSLFVDSSQKLALINLLIIKFYFNLLCFIFSPDFSFPNDPGNLDSKIPKIKKHLQPNRRDFFFRELKNFQENKIIILHLACLLHLAFFKEALLLGHKKIYSLCEIKNSHNLNSLINITTTNLAKHFISIIPS